MHQGVSTFVDNDGTKFAGDIQKATVSNFGANQEKRKVSKWHVTPHNFHSFGKSELWSSDVLSVIQKKMNNVFLR